MKRNAGESDQLYDWSERREGTSQEIAPASRKPYPATAVDKSRVFTGLAHRAVQEVRQAWVQMCPRTRARSQILLVGEHSRASSGDDLRAAGLPKPGREIPGESSGCPRSIGRDLRSQPRVTTTTGRFLKNGYGIGIYTSDNVYRSVQSRNRGGQHDSGSSLFARTKEGRRG